VGLLHHYGGGMTRPVTAVAYAGGAGEMECPQSAEVEMETTKRMERANSSEGCARPRLRPARLRALAERLCPHKTDGKVRHELVPAGGPTLTSAGARALAIDQMAATVSRTCEWGEPIKDWDVGDHRFLVLEFWPRKGVCLYVQIWTEPLEPVLVEACSGAWNPTARPYVRGPQRAALRALGYAVGGRARNYQKRWTLSPLADARALADELLTILIDIFGYRGNRALGMGYCSEGRTEEGRVFPALAIDDVKGMLSLRGCRVVSAEPIGPVKPSVKKRLIHVAQPFPFTVEMRGQATKTPATYEAMRLITVLEGGRGVSRAQVEVMSRACPFGRIVRDPDGDLLLIQDLLVAQTTVRWFLMAVNIWQFTRTRAAELVQHALASAGPSGPGDPGTAREPDEDGDPDDIDIAEDGDEGEAGDRELRQSRAARTVVH